MFTFKKDAKSFYYHIKIKGVKIGVVDSYFPHKIRLFIIKNDIDEDGNINCNKGWLILQKNSVTINEAKAYLKKNFSSITSIYKLADLQNCLLINTKNRKNEKFTKTLAYFLERSIM